MAVKKTTSTSRAAAKIANAIKAEPAKAAKTAAKAVKEEEKTAVKAEKKAPVKKAASKKAELKTEMFLQFAGKEYTDKEIFDKIKYVWSKVLKNKVGDMKDVKIYLKPEESAAYYVINGDTTGKVDL